MRAIVDQGERRRRPIATTLLIAAASAIAGGSLVWAGTVVLQPAEDVLTETAFTTVAVAQGEVSSSITLSAVAAWQPVPFGTNLAAGTVTSVSVQQGDQVTSGTAIYTVDLRPVVVAQGSVPAFRSMEQGIDGADVSQLQELLTSLNVYTGPVDGRFGWSTRRAVQKWQRQLGVTVDGAVHAGDLIFVPSLPARVAVDTEKITRGARLNGGEEVLMGLPPEPVFTLPVTQSQSALIPVGTRVEITSGDGTTWEAVAGSRSADPDSPDQIDILLTGEDGSAICRDACAEIPVVGDTTMRASVITQETVAGLIVPTAALLTKADGSVVVIDADGDEHPVSIVAAAKGMTVVTGVLAGLDVRLPVAAS